MKKLLLAAALAVGTITYASATAHAWGTTCQASNAHYQKLETGMTYSKVVAVLGCEGDEMSSAGSGTYKVVSYMWSGNGSAISNMVVMVSNGKVMAKAKVDLK